jgi:D-cysteine desulfhydrase
MDSEVWTVEAFDQCVGFGLGLDVEASPVSTAPKLAKRLGLGSLNVKRDDALAVLHGGTKLRKLEYLLGREPFASAEEWHAVGSIGSGNLVAITRVAARQGKRLVAHCFWTPLTSGIIENLSQLDAPHVRLCYAPSRLALFVRRPWLFLGHPSRAIVPPGATCAAGMIGMARGGVELAGQVQAGLCPAPDRIYVPFGTGGIAAGLAVGLALGGLKTEVHAVAVAERILSPTWRLTQLTRACVAELSRAGVSMKRRVTPIRVVRGFLGDGYAAPTPAASAACSIAQQYDFTLDEVYTGKAFAALQAEADTLGSSTDVLFWLTLHDPDQPQPREGWRDRLPVALRQRLNAATGNGISRRRWLLGGVSVLAAALTGIRLTGYPRLAGWSGAVLAPWECHVLRASIEAVAPPDLSSEALATILDDAPAKIDAFLAGMPTWFLREVHALFVFIEHGTPLGLQARRFSALPIEARRLVFARLHDHGWLMRTAARGIRDLALMGIYQHPVVWPELGYEGPWVDGEASPLSRRGGWRQYEALRAPRGASPL